MKTAAIYCRVSTEDQEREGTSLDSQLEACERKASELGYEVSQDFSIREVYSGSTLDRPKLTQLRQWVRDKEVDAVIAYTLDRLSRDPIHCIIIQEELERSRVKFILVTETVDSSDLGKLITHIRGYAAKLEAEKIRERTMRGKKARVERHGKLPTGRGVIYGYSYDRESGTNLANSCLDIVSMAGLWVLQEGIFLNEACRRLMAMGVPAPKGGTRWSRSTLGRILRNPTYAGKTYAYKTTTIGKKRTQCPRDNWVEVPNGVDRVAFDCDEWLGIQRQLDRNRELSPRNQKLAYLLKGMVFCKLDGRKYYGVPMHGKPYYRCSGRNPLLSEKICSNRSVSAKWLEETTWLEVEKVLKSPELILAELERQRKEGTESTHLEEQSRLNHSRLNTLDEAETRYLRLYGISAISEAKLVEECKRIRQEQQKIEQENMELEKRIKSAKETKLDIESVRRICKLAAQNLANFTLEQKRLALQALNIKAWVDGDCVTVEGVLPIPEADIALQPL